MSNSRDDNIHIHIRINRKVGIAVVVSLLVHVLALLLLSRFDLLNQHPPALQDQTLDVQLSPPRQVASAAPPQEIRQPTQQKPAPAPKIKTVPPPRPMPPPDIASTPIVPPPTPTPKPPPVLPKPAAVDPGQYTDMASYVNAARERRRLAGEDADIRNEDARKQPEESRRNAPPSGTSGVFSITRMDSRSATFAFRGWRNELSYSHREVYEVQAGQDGDVPRAVIRKMIEIIRRYYTGDFNWDSPRMGRMVVLSARLQDNDGLEDFLIQEFFGITARH